MSTYKLPSSRRPLIDEDQFPDYQWYLYFKGLSASGNYALTTSTLAQFAPTTSLELKTLITDETGSGALVFATSPTLVTPALGTPSSGVLTNCTSIPAGQLSGTVAVANGGNGVTSQPSFRAYAGSNTTITASSTTKIALNTESWDTANCFDSTTNYRFTPNVAGIYVVSFGVYLSNALVDQPYGPRVYKNGSLWTYGWYGTTGVANDFVMNGSSIVSMNGTTDYIELFCFNGSGSSVTALANNAGTWFSAAWQCPS